VIRALRDRWRRPVTAFPAAALALALSCAGVLAAQPATAADDPTGGLPDANLSQPAKPAASAKELRDRIVEAAKATGETSEELRDQPQRTRTRTHQRTSSRRTFAQPTATETTSTAPAEHRQPATRHRERDRQPPEPSRTDRSRSWSAADRSTPLP